LDFAIDNMMGEEFVKKAVEFIKAKTSEEIHGFGVTKFNPEKSKHLETAKVQIRNIWIDVVNLRGEVYDTDSRIPKITIGTAEEDAFRRDLTINSLFYNLNEGKIEDFTKKGIEDLKNGIIRTPIVPVKTFQDDPLRILRIIRFASRFSFRIVPEIVESLKHTEITDGLKGKVSRERVGVELNSMLLHKSAHQSIKYFHEFGLFPHIIEIPPNAKGLSDSETLKQIFTLSYKMSEKFYEILEQNGSNKYLQSLTPAYPVTEIDKSQLRYYSYLSMMLSPLAQYKVENKNKKLDSLVCTLMKDSIKANNKDSEIITLVTESSQKFSELRKTFETSKTILKDTAKAIKDMGKLYGTIWELSFITAFINDIIHAESKLAAEQLSNSYDKFYEFIYKNGLAMIYDLQTLIDGQEVKTIFNITHGGPIIKKILDNIFYWQVENPGKTREDLIATINQNSDLFKL